MFKQYTVRIGIPESKAAEREQLKMAIASTYPGMRIKFEFTRRVTLLGVEGPDLQSAAIILPLLDKLIASTVDNRHF